MLGLIGAMDIEIEALVKSLENKNINKRGLLEFFEGDLFGERAVCVCCGIGKVYSAAAAALMIELFRPDRIINLGVAGGIGNIGDLVIADRCVQHDVDAAADGLPQGQLVGRSSPYFECDSGLANALTRAVEKCGFNYERGVIATGDQFICDTRKAQILKESFGAVAVDMESAAIAQVAETFNIPFVSVRAVSDSAGDGAVGDYDTFKTAAAIRSIKVLKEYVLGASDKYGA